MSAGIAERPFVESGRRLRNPQRQDPMRILHIHKVSGIGGAEQHLLTLLPALVRRGFEVHVCSLTTGRGHEFVRRLTDMGVQPCSISAGPDFNPLAMAQIARRVRQIRPDLIHTHLIHGDVHGQPVARIFGIPAVSSFHGTPSFYRRPPVREAGRLMGALATCRVAISEHVREFLLELHLARSDRIRVIPYGLAAGPWRAAASRRLEHRQQLGMGLGDVVIGIAARLVSGKGHRLLIDAMRRARVQEPALRLLVAGEGPMRADLVRAAGQECGRSIRFLGFVDDMPSFMAACDVCVFPTEASLGEGFGLSALEAMAAGCPVVATRVGSLPEVVTEDSGIVIAPGSPDALADALLRLARHQELRQRLGRQATARAIDQFSLERMVGSTVDLYAAARG